MGQPTASSGPRRVQLPIALGLPDEAAFALLMAIIIF
jgi:hypothetical protein